MKRRFAAYAGLTAAFAAGVAAAQDDALRITPVPAIGTAVADIARSSEQMAEGTVVGGGRWLRVVYRSGVPIAGFVAPMRGASYNPVDMMAFELPASPDPARAEIDLSASPSWNPSEKPYLVTLASPASALPPEIQGVEFVAAGAGDVAGAFIRHLAGRESYVISTYHHLRGYRVLGVGLVPIAVALFAIACVASIVLRRGAAITGLLAVALGAQLLYGARVGIDLVRLSAAHGFEWTSRGTYGEAGSMYDLADAVREDADGREDARLAVCFDSTDYFAKILRYRLLPIPVDMTTDGAVPPTHVAVVRKIDWTFDGGRLRCGSIDAPATLVREFPDGSRLFELLAP